MKAKKNDKQPDGLAKRTVSQKTSAPVESSSSKDVKTPSTPLSTAITNFVTNLSNLRDFVSLIGPFLEEQHSSWIKANKKDLGPLMLLMSMTEGPLKGRISAEGEKEIREDFGANFTITVDPSDGKGSLTIDSEVAPRVQDALKNLGKGSQHHSLLYRSSLISLVSTAEWFLSQIIRYYYQSHPDAAGIKEKTLRLDDLAKLGSIEEAKQYLINQRIDEIMWGGLEDWIQTLASTMKLSMGYLEDNRHALVEVFQRRNVMVHNNGVVHSSYLAKVHPDFRQDVRHDTELSVEPAYLEQAIDLIEINFILIAAELWKKLEPKDERRATVLTNTVAFHALTTERWAIAEGASRFAMGDKEMSELSFLMAKLNYWQSLKWQGRFAEVRSEVEAVDFSAKGDIFQLAKLTLLDEYEKAATKAAEMVRIEKLKIAHLLNWPIFRELRERPELKPLFDESAVAEPEGEEPKAQYVN